MPQSITDEKSILVQVTVTWTDVDPDQCRHMASQNHYELNKPYFLYSIYLKLQMIQIKNNYWISHWLQNTTQFIGFKGSRSHKYYSDVIMRAMASQITGVSLVCSTVCSGADQGKYQSSASLAFVRGIHWCPVTFLHKGPVTRKTFPFDEVIMIKCYVFI